MKRLIQLLRVIVAMLVVATIATVIAIKYHYKRGNDGTWEDVGGRATANGTREPQLHDTRRVSVNVRTRAAE